MAKNKSTGNKKSNGGSKKGRPPMVTKAGYKPGSRYCGGGKLK